ncbi:MAG: hypothetical protein KGL53_04605, partial [Elusimicrobia bacterium]|nr:hypothetical protein [Elusimicrobiota bacterium]
MTDMRAARTLTCAVLAALAAAGRAYAAADAAAPSLVSYGVADCDGNLQYNPISTSTGTPDKIVVTVQDKGMGLRFGVSPHVGGSA